MIRSILLITMAVPSLLAGQRDSVKARESYLAGRQAMREKRTSDAINAFNRAVELNDRFSEFFVWLGHAHTRDIQKANVMRQPIVARRIKGAYDRAVALDSTSIDAAEARFEFYLNAPGIAGGGMDRARGEAARLKRLDSFLGDFALGWVEEREGRLTAAEGLYNGVIRASPDSTTRARAEARLRIVRGKQAAARKPQ
jgi:tetratricopeptide (TPR) repeat protein